MQRSCIRILGAAMAGPLRRSDATGPKAPSGSLPGDVDLRGDLREVGVQLREVLLHVEVELRVDVRRGIEGLLELPAGEQRGNGPLHVAVDRVLGDAMVVA